MTDRSVLLLPCSAAGWMCTGGRGTEPGRCFLLLAIILPGGEERRGGRGVSRSTQSEGENEAEEERRKGLVCVIYS